MRVLAVDPGYGRCGFAILEKTTTGENLLFSECFETSSRDDFNTRLHLVGNRCEELIITYHPQHLALEDLFFSKNTKTAMDVAQVRGAILRSALVNNLSVYEPTPNQVKVAVTGYGKANKDDVTRMVTKLIPLQERNYVDDEIDAIAIGLAFLAEYKTLNL